VQAVKGAPVPAKGAPPPVSAVPQPQAGLRFGNWGLVAGLLALWGGYVLMWHGKSLNFSLSALGSPQLYGMTYAGGSAGAVVGAFALHAWRLGITAAVSAAALGYGLAALALVRVAWPGPGLRALIALGAGFSLEGLLLLGLGFSGLWYGPLAFVVVAGGCGALARAARARAAGTRAAGARAGFSPRALLPPLARDAGGVVFMAIALFAAVLITAVALAPEVFYDSLVYHMADPFNWVKAHRVHPMPYNFFSNFPFTLEMLFSLGLFFGGDQVSRLIHAAVSFSAAGLVGWTAWWLAGRSVPAGWVAATVTLTTPLIAESAWMTGIDAGLVLYETAAVVLFIMWWIRGKARFDGWLLLAAAFGGLGMGLKYTVGIAVGLIGLGVAMRSAAPTERDALRGWLGGILALALPWTLSNVREVRETAALAPVLKPLLALYCVGLVGATGWLARRWGVGGSVRGVGRAVLYGLVAGACVLPWNLKAFLATMNPVFPFAFGLIPSFHVDPYWMGYQMGEFREFSYRPLVEWLVHPWHLTRIAELSNNSACGAVFLAFLPFLLLMKGVDARVKVLAVVLLGRYLAWSNVSNIVRYFAPGLALMGVLIAVFVERARTAGGPGRPAALAVLGLLTGLNIFGMLLIAQFSSGFFGVVTGQESLRDNLLRQRPSYPAPPYAGCEAMNQLLPKDAGVLFVGEARGYFCSRRLKASTVFDYPVLHDVCAASRTPADVNRKLRQMGLTHVFLNTMEAMRTSGYHVFRWSTPREEALFREWWSGYLKLVWAGGMQEVYEVVPKGAGRERAPMKLVMTSYPAYKELSDAQGRAMGLVQQGRAAEGEAGLRELLKRAPWATDVQELLAQFLAVAGKDRQAYDAYRKAFAMGAYSRESHYNLAILAQRLGRRAEAEQEFARARALENGYVRVSERQVPVP